MFYNVFDRIQKTLCGHLIPGTTPAPRGRRAAVVLLAGLFLACGSAVGATSAAAPASTDAAKHVAANYGKIPLSFEPNKGQTDLSVQFLSRGSGYSLFLTKDEVVLNLERQNAPAATADQKRASAPIDTLRMKLFGANPTAIVTGLEPQSGTVSYLIGNDHTKWHTGIPTYGASLFLWLRWDSYSFLSFLSIPAPTPLKPARFPAPPAPSPGAPSPRKP